jgi:hypothetical protein
MRQNRSSSVDLPTFDDRKAASAVELELRFTALAASDGVRPNAIV